MVFALMVFALVVFAAATLAWLTPLNVGDELEYKMHLVARWTFPWIAVFLVVATVAEY